MKKGEKLLTEFLFFDTDCLSAFLWINRESLLAKLYPGRIAIPKQVYNELSMPTVPHLKKRADRLLNNKTAVLVHIEACTAESELYFSLINPDYRQKVIGKGEAASITLAKYRNGILASNNLKDVAEYVNKFNLRHITTGDILKEALNHGLISEEQGNEIWENMLAKRRKLGFDSFSAFLLRSLSRKSKNIEI